MDINLLESMFLGLISGLSEFMPVSSVAHEMLFLRVFGIDQVHPLLQLSIHIGIVIALILSSSAQLKRMNREYRYAQVPKRRRRRQPDRQTVLDAALLKSAIIPMLLGMLLYGKAQIIAGKMYLIALFLFINGIVLHAVMYLPRGNKDSRHMCKLDGPLLGLVSVIGIIPGFSRTGLTCSIAVARGADVSHAYKWAVLLGIPALAVIICFDLISIFVTGLAGVGFLFFVQCLFSAVTAYFGAIISMKLMRSLTSNNGISGFSYYCWGAALFMFILYLI